MGDLIYFMYLEQDDKPASHIGIVRKVEGGRVYTIEGNSSDSTVEKDYPLSSSIIKGYSKLY